MCVPHPVPPSYVMSSPQGSRWSTWDLILSFCRYLLKWSKYIKKYSLKPEPPVHLKHIITPAWLFFCCGCNQKISNKLHPLTPFLYTLYKESLSNYTLYVNIHINLQSVFSGTQTKHFPMEGEMERNEKYLQSEKLFFLPFQPLPHLWEDYVVKCEMRSLWRLDSVLWRKSDG